MKAEEPWRFAVFGLAVVAVAIGASGCAAPSDFITPTVKKAPTPTVTSTPNSTPTQTSTPGPTPTAEVTATREPTPTPKPAETATEEPTETPEPTEQTEIQRNIERFRNNEIPKKEDLFENREGKELEIGYIDKFTPEDGIERAEIHGVLLGAKQIDNYQVLIIGTRDRNTKEKAVIPIIIGNDNSITLQTVHSGVSTMNAFDYDSSHFNYQRSTPEELIKLSEEFWGRPFRFNVQLEVTSDEKLKENSTPEQYQDFKKYYYPHVPFAVKLVEDPVGLQEQIGDVQNPDLSKAPISWGMFKLLIK